jgi:nitrous oxidase accessory protein NosD
MLSQRARGILIKTRNVLVERCLIRETTGTGIEVGAESGWHEGPPSANVIIRYNRIIRCGLGAGLEDHTSGIVVKIEARETDVPGLHKHLLIEGNIIEGEGAERGISVSQAEDVTIRYNQIWGCRQPIVVAHSNQAHVYSNSGVEYGTNSYGKEERKE